jgi:hypothetical protein
LKLLRHHIICLVFCLFFKFSFGQGRVVINEFMPWSGCSAASEFIELLNFGPGPMNIGCYVVTNGTYSVTIPPNIILQRGQYFILSGQDILSKGCGNVDSAVHVDLNWTTCNCTNIAIPTTGDGFLQNGGSANEKVILLDPGLNVVDAVSRNIPVSPSNPITTSSLAGTCTSKIFDLDTMSINYESINNSTGIDNSFARKVDGDCGWVKTTAISAHAPNKTGSSASVTYDFTTVRTNECGPNGGSISIQVNSSDIGSLFPMNYTLGYDINQNGLLDGGDQYQYGVDNTASTIDISNLAYGRYRITVASSSSCNLKSFDVYVFNCYTLILPVNLLYFKYDGEQNGQKVFKLKVDNATAINTIILEAKVDGEFKAVITLFGPFNQNEIVLNTDATSATVYRLKLTNHPGMVSYSQEIKLPSQNTSIAAWPNPVKERVFIKLHAISRGQISYSIMNGNGGIVTEANVEVNNGDQTIFIPTIKLNGGIYYLKMQGQPLQQPISLRFIK